MTHLQRSIKRYLTHYTLDKCGFSFTVFADKSYLFATLYQHIDITEHKMIAIALCHLVAYHRIITGTEAWRKLEVER